MKALKFVRVANKVVWLAVLSALNICVGYQWSKQGCGVESVIAAVLMYTAFCWCLYKSIDEYIKSYIDANEEK